MIERAMGRAMVCAAVLGLMTGVAGAADLATPEQALEAFKAAVTVSDLAAYKSLMSGKMTQRVEGDFLINQDIQKGKKYLDEIGEGELTVDGDKAAFSATSDDGKVITTRSIEFVREDSGWKLDLYRTSTKSK